MGVMKSRYIKNQVKIIIELHNTKNIFKICKHYNNIRVIFVNFTKKETAEISFIRNIFFIGINKNLSKQQKIDILIHEFAHFILHDKYLRC